jgi:hypothetical protein
MKYKISEEPLKLKEFGRNVQGMVDHAMTIEDREKRTLVAQEIVRILITLNPQLKDVPEFKQKLWDAVFILSEYKLDVDSPYPMPPRPDEVEAPKRLDYVKGKPRYKQYGRNVQIMIEKAGQMPEGPQKMEYLSLIANTMQQFLFNVDRKDTSEEVIVEHIRDISDGRIKVKADELTFLKPTPPPPKPPQNKRNNKRSSSNSKRSSSNHKRRRKN